VYKSYYNKMNIKTAQN